MIVDTAAIVSRKARWASSRATSCRTRWSTTSTKPISPVRIAVAAGPVRAGGDRWAASSCSRASIDGSRCAIATRSAEPSGFGRKIRHTSRTRKREPSDLLQRLGEGEVVGEEVAGLREQLDVDLGPFAFGDVDDERAQADRRAVVVPLVALHREQAREPEVVDTRFGRGPARHFQVDDRLTGGPHPIEHRCDAPPDIRERVRGAATREVAALEAEELGERFVGTRDRAVELEEGERHGRASQQRVEAGGGGLLRVGECLCPPAVGRSTLQQRTDRGRGGTPGADHPPAGEVATHDPPPDAPTVARSARWVIPRRSTPPVRPVVQTAHSDRRGRGAREPVKGCGPRLAGRRRARPFPRSARRRPGRASASRQPSPLPASASGRHPMWSTHVVALGCFGLRVGARSFRHTCSSSFVGVGVMSRWFSACVPTPAGDYPSGPDALRPWRGSKS